MEGYSAKSLFKNTLIISIGSVGAGIIKMFNVLCLTYFVATSQMGDYDLAITYASLLVPVACLAMYEGVFRWMLDEKVSKEDTARTSMTIMMISIAIFEIVAFFVMTGFGYTLWIEMLALMIGECVNTYSQYMLRGLHHNKLFAIQGILYAAVLVATNILLVIIFSLQASGLIWSVVLADVASIMFAFMAERYITQFVFKGKFDGRLAKDMLKYSLPIMPNTTAWWLVSGSNRLIISGTLGLAANGIFAIANRFPSILNVFTRFFYQAWQEESISKNNEAQRDSYYSKIFNIYARILLSAIVFLLPCSKLIITLISQDYYEAYLYLGPLYLSSAFSAMAAFYGTGYLSSRKTMGAFTTTIIGAVVTVLITLLAIAHIGLFAAAFGSMLGNLAIWIARIVQTRKYFHIKIEWPIFLLLIASCTAMSWLLTFDAIPVVLFALGLSSVFFIAVNRNVIVKMFRLFKGKKS